MSTDILFEPIQIGNVELKNRIAMSPMNMGYTGRWDLHPNRPTHGMQPAPEVVLV